VLVYDLAEIHPVQLITRENENEIVSMPMEVDEIAPDRICGTLIPSAALFRLLRGKNVNEPTTKRIELVTLLDVPME
jgi:hypothetical protein